MTTQVRKWRGKKEKGRGGDERVCTRQTDTDGEKERQPLFIESRREKEAVRGEKRKGKEKKRRKRGRQGTERVKGNKWRAKKRKNSE